MNLLADLDIVVTRPAAQARPWQQLLQSHGATTIAIPVMDIAPIEASDQKQRAKQTLLKLDQFQIALFVSQNAVHYAADWIDNYWPQRPIDIDYFAVGTATAKAAQECGFDVTAAEAAMDSETLLQLPALKTVKNKKIVIFRGVGGRPTLENVLTERGATVTLCELYQRCLPPEASTTLNGLNLAKAPRKTVLSVHSGESLENLYSVIRDDQRAQLLALPLLVPGERVAQLARAKGFSEIITSINATDQAMTDALVSWHSPLPNKESDKKSDKT